MVTSACSNSGGGSGGVGGGSGATGGNSNASCATWLNGTARNDSNNQVIGLFKNCTGYNETCGDTYTYTVDYSDNNQVQFTLNIKGSGNCDQTGVYVCTAVRSAQLQNKISIACGANAANIFTRMAWEL